MDTKEELLACLARLQFTGKGGVYTLELKSGLGIHVAIDESGYVIMPLVDVPKLLPRGKTIDDFAEGPADKFSWRMHVTSSDFDLERFVKNIGKVRNYLKRVADFYA